MPDYGDFCPVQMAAEVVADRWTPLIIRELVLGNTRFNDIARAMPGISRSLLVQRLRHLERKGVLETWPAPTGRGSEYHLTPSGKDLERVIDSLGRWAIEWLFDDLRPHDVPPTTLMWWMRRRVNVEALPPVRTVVEFRHTAPEPETIWMVIDRSEVSMCLAAPRLRGRCHRHCGDRNLLRRLPGLLHLAGGGRRRPYRRRGPAPPPESAPALVPVESVGRRDARARRSGGRQLT